MDEELRESYRTLEKRLLHEGRTVTSSFISENNMLPFFQDVGLEPFLTLNESICPRFVVKFYHSLEVKRDEELRTYIEFKLGQFTFKLTPSRLSQILKTPHALKTFYTSKWPDIMFSVCLCAHFQENPKTTCLEAVKRRFSNEAVNTAFEVTTIGTRVNAPNSTNIDNLSDAIICAFLASQSNSSQLVNKDLEEIHPDDLEEMDLKWQIAMLTMIAKRFLKKIGRKLNLNGNETVAFDKTKVKCYNCHKKGRFARECRAQDNRNKQSTRRNVPFETTNSSALVSCDGLGGYDWSDQAKEGPNYALMAYFTSIYDSEIADKYKAGLRYNVVPRPYTGNFLPPKPDLSGLEEFLNEPIVNEPTVKKPVVETSEAKASEDKPKVVRKNYSPPLIEEWISNSEDKAESMPKIEKKTVKPSFAKIEFIKSKEQVKSSRKTILNNVINIGSTHINLEEIKETGIT
nr:hypothetical protein [Tanacetum cinerariifolium]